VNNVVFFEVQEWEKDALRKAFPDATFVEEKLESANASSYQNAEIISCFIYSSLTKDVIDHMIQLKCIATRSTGFDHIDVPYCKSKSIHVANVPEYGSNTVAEHTFALILSLTRKIYQSINQAKSLVFEHKEIRGIDLYGKTIGIIGIGKIGKQVLRIAKGFGMNVVVFSRSQDDKLSAELGFSYTNLDTLLHTADIVTLHLPLTKETHHIIDRNNILKFKKGSYLLNTARGGLVDTEAIVIGLEQEILEGVGLDVLEEEKELGEEVDILTSQFKKRVNLKNLVFNHILMNHPKVLITPHNAFNSKEALMRIVTTTIENIKGCLEGNCKNYVA